MKESVIKKKLFIFNPRWPIWVIYEGAISFLFLLKKINFSNAIVQRNILEKIFLGSFESELEQMKKKEKASINDSGCPRKVKVILLAQLHLSEFVERKNNLYRWSSLSDFSFG